MTPNISKELKKATEILQTKMLAMQEEEAKMLALKTAFVNATDPVKKEKAKPALIAQAKKLKQAEAEADAADKAFHKILSTEPEEIYDLLDHKVQEHIVRMAVRKIVKETINLQESEEVSLKDEVESFFNSNKKKLESLADDDNWDEFYELGFEKFPEADQDDVAQAMNNAAMAAGWFENEIEDFRQSEKELEDMAFGSKAQQKGVNMGDYDKKMKQPKNPENIKESFKKKGRVTEITVVDSKKVDSFLTAIKSSVKSAKIVQQVTNFINIARLDPYASYKDLLKDLLLFYKGNREVYNVVQAGLQESKKKEALCEIEQIEEAEYQGRKVKLGKPFYTPGGPRKRAVYVRNDKGNVVKVGFGEPGMKIKKNNPARRKSFRARHKCDTNPGPRWKARYWSCKFW